jgi:hypothetical protein
MGASLLGFVPQFNCGTSLLTFQFFALPIPLSSRRQDVTRKDGTGKLGNMSQGMWEINTRLMPVTAGYRTRISRTKPIRAEIKKSAKLR